MQSSKSIFQSLDRKEIARKRSSEWYYAHRDEPGFKKNKRRLLDRWRILNPEQYLFQRAKARAKEVNVEFDLDVSDIQIPDVCPALKTPFEFRTPYATSIDRIDPKKGYIKGNVQVLSRKANLMKQDASAEELKKFAEWINQSHS